jgi:hypothetical protein
MSGVVLALGWGHAAYVARHRAMRNDHGESFWRLADSFGENTR